MKNFNSLSGPWVGFSVQDGLRISERLVLLIVNHQISGTGTDKDGKFEVDGAYNEGSSKIELTRRYTWTSEPTQSGVGIPYEYEGKWDGELAYGFWHPRDDQGYGGEFEMWPDQDEEKLSDTIGLQNREPLAFA